MGEVSLGEVAVPGGLVGGPFGSSLVANDYVPEGIPVVRGTNMLGRFVGGEYVFVSGEKFDRDLSRNSATTGDLIFTQRGTLGQVSRIPDSSFAMFVVSQSQMRLRVDQTLADPAYVYYACTTDHFHRQVQDNAVATGVPHINLGTLRRLTIPAPDLPTQRAIAAVLTSLDDKIAANDRVTKTSDALVRARYLDLPPGRRALGEIVSNVRVMTAPNKAGGARYIGFEHLPRGRMWVSDWGQASAVESQKATFQRGDILFGKLRPYFHKVAWAPFNGICSTDILVLRSKQEQLRGYALAAAADAETVAYAVTHSEGTRMPRANWRDLANAQIRWPGSVAALEFSREVESYAMASEALMHENTRLAATRDELLPLLMSGRISVREAEEAAG